MNITEEIQREVLSRLLELKDGYVAACEKNCRVWDGVQFGIIEFSVTWKDWKLSVGANACPDLYYATIEYLSGTKAEEFEGRSSANMTEAIIRAMATFK